MTLHQLASAGDSDGGTSPFFYVVLALFSAMALVQIVRPQLLWRLNRPFQKPFVRDYDAAEPNARGYALQRVIGVGALIMAGFILATTLT
ncbi:DUF6199 family natural product biosynthesis protein [Streptomyces sp. ODS05-4]|uniref:DUF6199 family natural product biosynthesis protein n=1 Tax=Streptomyces sp. ODS05-4 TaxID=2944939 RepID=UPI00210D2324|nr:DUF6199 family natural product biosynthesis protein [Streptomyces sp. ODS05-4]